MGKHLYNFEKFKQKRRALNITNEELNIGDVFSNLFKSKEKKQLESSIKEWDSLNKKFIDIFSKNERWKEYLSKFSYYDGVTDNLYKYWRSFINSDIVHYPFKVNGKNYTELNSEETSLLKKLIEQSIKMRSDLVQIVDRVQKSSTQLEQNWKKITDEFGEDKLSKVEGSGEIRGKIDTRIDLLKTILENLTNGEISLSSNINTGEFNKLITDIFLYGKSIEEYRMDEDKKINYLKVFLDIAENFDVEKIKDKIKESLRIISGYKKMKEKFNELEINKLITDCGLYDQIDVVGHKYNAANICKDLGFSPDKFNNKKEEFSLIKKVSDALINSKLDYSKSIDKLIDLCDSVLNKNDFLKKLQITTSEIIKENNLTNDDIYFTHSSKMKEDLTIDKIKFEYDVDIRGERDDSTPQHAYGFYITGWKNGERKDYDTAHYMTRSKESAGFLGYDKISLYVIKLKNDSKFLKSIDANFSQTNQSTKEFAEYCISIGLSGYYHPRPYGTESALEVVLIDKQCIESFKKDDEVKKRVLGSIKK